ncbi:MAG: hypothetical protein ABJL54_10390 [Halioglobus sp.]|jgi:hypothetical protein
MVILALEGCAIAPDKTTQQGKGVAVCDSYLILSMCVQDLDWDGTVDVVYFTDTKEAFMYQGGKQDLVGEVMPFHRCAVELNKGMQATTNRILDRADLSLVEEVSITKELISNYVASKPAIDACNAKFETATGDGGEPETDFSQFEESWDLE